MINRLLQRAFELLLSPLGFALMAIFGTDDPADRRNWNR